MSTVLVLGAIGCGGNDEPSKAPKTTNPCLELPGPSGSAGPELANSIAAISRRLREEIRRKKCLPDDVSSSFCLNTNENPQPMYSSKPARLIVNTLCQPSLGEPASVYRVPKYEKEEEIGEVQDGDVVEAHCIDPNGVKMRNALGERSASTTWVKISHGSNTGYISEVNLAYVQDSQFEECNKR